MVGDRYPTFRLHRAKAGTVPEGVTHVGTLMTPDGETYGVHARVVEREDGHKEFVGGLFRVDSAPDESAEAVAA